MSSKQITQMEEKVARIKGELARLGPMRPGSVSKQYRDPAGKKGAFYQLSYTHKMKSRSEHVWPEHVKAIRAENAEYKKFKRLTGELIDLSIELSRAKIHLLREEARKP